ncbi:MAG: NifB/NifX family molybdenum-iron cluster-binding protein [bacterium]
MKIAAITDDGKRLSAHFGRARHYLVHTVEDGEVVARELRDKAVPHDEEHEHDHHEHGHGRGQGRGHGFGHGAARRHAAMLAAIEDCDVVLARGMGQGAYLALQEAKVTPINTEIKLISDAVDAYLAGDIVDRPERRH